MKDEVYDVLDKNGKIVDKGTWTEVHTKGLLHQTAHAILFKDDSLNETLFKRRVDTSVQEPGKYEIAVSGHVLSGEPIENALNREISEELFGDNPIPESLLIKKIGTYRNQDIPNNNEVAHLFVIIHPGPFNVHSKESDKFRWIKWETLLSEMSTKQDIYAAYSRTAISEYKKIRDSIKP